MKEFIYATNGWDWKFYRYKTSISPERYVYLLYTETKDKYFYEVVPGVFAFIEYVEDKYMNKIDKHKEPELYETLMKKFFCPLTQMNMLELAIVSLQIVNKDPMLRFGTLMGWSPFDDKTKDPNYYEYPCIFPDGNDYTVTLHKGTLSVFPGHGTAYGMIGTRLPLVSHQIDLETWAKKCENPKDDSIIIGFKDNVSAS